MKERSKEVLKEGRSNINLIGIPEEVIPKEECRTNFKNYNSRKFSWNSKKDLKLHPGRCSWEYQSRTKNAKMYSSKIWWLKLFEHLEKTQVTYKGNKIRLSSHFFLDSNVLYQENGVT